MNICIKSPGHASSFSLQVLITDVLIKYRCFTATSVSSTFSTNTAMFSKTPTTIEKLHLVPTQLSSNHTEQQHANNNNNNNNNKKTFQQLAGYNA